MRLQSMLALCLMLVMHQGCKSDSEAEEAIANPTGLAKCDIPALLNDTSRETCVVEATDLVAQADGDAEKILNSPVWVKFSELSGGLKDSLLMSLLLHEKVTRVWLDGKHVGSYAPQIVARANGSKPKLKAVFVTPEKDSLNEGTVQSLKASSENFDCQYKEKPSCCGGHGDGHHHHH